MTSPVILLCTSLLFLLLVVPTHGQNPTYHVSNDVPGTEAGNLYDSFGYAWWKNQMQLATSAVLQVLDIVHHPGNMNHHTDVYLTIKDGMRPDYGAVTTDNKIAFNADMFPFHEKRKDLGQWVVAILYHEMTHVWQNTGGVYTTEVRGFREGSADFVSFQSHIVRPTCRRWKPTPADYQAKWYKGYCPTAFFLEYLTKRPQKINYVAELTSLIIKHRGYKEDDFKTLLGGLEPDLLWNSFLNNYQPPPPEIGGGEMLAGGWGCADDEPSLQLPSKLVQRYLTGHCV